MTPAFGTIYGDPSTPSYITPEGPVWMWRKGQKVRFFTADGVQVGPEQRNVGPAVCAAIAAGWFDVDWHRAVANGLFVEVTASEPEALDESELEQVRR